MHQGGFLMVLHLSLIHIYGDGILTHCNAGPLATSRYGTALGPLFLGKEKGMNFKVFSDETRPLLQGARLTSFELCKAGIDVTLICDNMASIVMKNGWVQACFCLLYTSSVWQTLENGLNMIGVQVGIQRLVIGISVVFAVLLDVVFRKGLFKKKRTS